MNRIALLRGDTTQYVIHLFKLRAQAMCDYTNKATQKYTGTCGRRMGSDLLNVEREVVVEDAMDLGE